MKRYLCLLGLWLTLPATAVVISALPPPPPASGEVQSTITTGSANSQATQALIDQLFNNADYQNFHEQSASPPVLSEAQP